MNNKQQHKILNQRQVSKLRVPVATGCTLVTTPDFEHFVNKVCWRYPIKSRISIMYTSLYVKLRSRRPDTLHLLRVLNKELFLFFNLGFLLSRKINTRTLTEQQQPTRIKTWFKWDWGVSSFTLDVLSSAQMLLYNFLNHSLTTASTEEDLPLGKNEDTRDQIMKKQQKPAFIHFSLFVCICEQRGWSVNGYAEK